MEFPRATIRSKEDPHKLSSDKKFKNDDEELDMDVYIYIYIYIPTTFPSNMFVEINRYVGR